MASPPPPAAGNKHSNFVRLASLQLGDLPWHPELPTSDSSGAERPSLLAFLITLLDDGADFLSPSAFGSSFKHRSTKPARPSASNVEVLSYSIPVSSLASIEWTPNTSRTNGPQRQGEERETPPRRPSRSKPRSVGSGEHWFARKSIHKDISSRDSKTPGHASWKEFVYGLRDEHSKHESEFTPTLYDAHSVVDWSAQVGELESQGKIKGRHGIYTRVSIGIYEMCHAIPAPLSPRCFPVVVVTASLGEDQVVAVTVPVNLGTKNVGSAFYSNGRNVKEGGTSQVRKEVVMGVYAAVETVRRDKEKGEVEWIMATASDAKGNLPMWMQKMGIPGAVVKDVAYFMKWIKSVDEGGVDSVKIA